MTHKICKRGHASSALPGGRNRFRACRECVKIAGAKRYKLDPVAKKAGTAKWLSEHREERKAYLKRNATHIKTRMQKHRVNNLEKYMLRGALKRAGKAGVECTITEADIVIPERCPWLGIPLTVSTGTRNEGSPSLDRIIPEIGYVRGNVIVISELANRIKSSATPEQIARVLKGLRSVYPQWLLID